MSALLCAAPAHAQAAIEALLRAASRTTDTAPAACGPVSSGATCNMPAAAGRSSGAVINRGAGNPINLITGNKYQREVDLPALPGVLGLELVRHYNSAFSKPTDANGIIGRGWRLSYETDLFVRGNSLHILQADGSRLIFNRDPNDPSTCASDDPSNGRITIRHTPDGPEYTWHWPEGLQLLFNPQGRLVQILAPTGEFVSLQRAPNGNLLKVADPQGRSLQLRYPDHEAEARNDRYQGVMAIDTPVGEFRYEYGSEAPKGSDIHPSRLLATLVRVHLPTSYDHDRKRHAWTDRGTTVSTVTRHYHHEDPKHPTLLTGISVAGAGGDGHPMQERIATYAYDAAGNGILSVKGAPLQYDARGTPVAGTGIEQVSLDRSEPGVTRVTGSGGVTVFRHAIIGSEYRLLEVRGPRCEGCGETNVRYGYDRVGRLTDTTRLSDAGLPLETTRIERDALGRKTRAARIRYANGKPGKPEILETYEYPPGGDGKTEPSSISRPSVVPGKQHRIRISYNAFRQPVRIEETGWTPAIDGKQALPISRSTSMEYTSINGRSLLVALRQDGETGERIRLEYDERGSYPVKIATADGNRTEILERSIDGRVKKLRQSDGERSSLLAIDHLPGGHTRSVTQTAEAPGEQSVTRRLSAQYDPLARLTELRMPAQVLRLLPKDETPSTLSPAQRPSRHDSADDDLVFSTGEAGSAAEREVTEIAVRSGTVAETVARRWLDDFGRLVALEYRDQGMSRASYDGGSDRLKTVIDGNGIETRLHYDRYGRKSLLERLDSTGQVLERVEYKHSGRLLSEQARFNGDDASKPDSVIRRTYNAFGDVTHEYQQSGDFAYAVHHEYDPEGRIVATWLSEHAAGATTALPKIHFDYQGGEEGKHADGITAGTGWIGKRQVVSEIKWLAPPATNTADLTPDMTASVAAGWRFGNGLVTRSEYQQTKDRGIPWKLLAHNDGVYAHTITSGAEGRILAAVRQPRNPGSTRSGVTTTTSAISGTSTISTAPSRERGELRSLSAPAAYDSAGRQRTHLRNNEIYQLTWTAAGELKEIRQGDKSVAVYQYDAEGRRIQKTVEGQPAATRRFIYSGKQLIAEADGTGKIIRQYIHLGWRPIAWMEPARSITSRAREFIAGPKLVYLHTDHRGAVTAATDDEKSILWTAEIDDRGAAKASAGRYQEFEQPLRLVNQYADLESGLHYNLARYYDPSTGQFLSPDPAGFDAGYLDLYSYANGDLLNLVDPDGWATIRYYAIDEGVKVGPNLQPNRGRWAFAIWGIAGHEDKVLVFDKGGSFLGSEQPSKLYEGAGSATALNDFTNHYTARHGFYSPTEFALGVADANAIEVVRKLTGQDLSRNCPTDASARLPPIQVGIQGTLDPTISDRREPNRLISCNENLDREEVLLRRIKKAIEIHEVKASGILPSTDKDCASPTYKACAAETWNPAVRPGTREMQPASYGWTQFTPLALIDALKDMKENDLHSIGISKIHVRELESRSRAVSNWFGRLVRSNATGLPDPKTVSNGWEGNGKYFEKETGLSRENYDRMVEFGRIAAVLKTVNARYRGACGDSSPCYWKLWEKSEPDLVVGLATSAKSNIGASKVQLNPYIRKPANAGEARAGFQWASLLSSGVGEKLSGALADKEKSDLIALAFLRKKIAQARIAQKVGKGQLSKSEEGIIARHTFFLQNGDKEYPTKVMPHFESTFCVHGDSRASTYLRMQELEIR